MSFSKRLASFKYAFQGLVILCRTQPNFLIHLAVALIAVLAAFWLSFDRTEWLLLILTITIVLAAEAFNSALEFLTDLVSPEYHPLAKKAKDVAAASVLLTAIGAVVVGILLYAPKLLVHID
jgi:diacylglycerol kinase